MTKEKFVSFTCDVCGNKTTIIDGGKYPYSEGWNYVYNFNMQIAKQATHGMENGIERIDEKDKHFCSKDCLKKFILSKIDYASSYRGEKRELENFNDVERNYKRQESIPSEFSESQIREKQLLEVEARKKQLMESQLREEKRQEYFYTKKETPEEQSNGPQLTRNQQEYADALNRNHPQISNPFEEPGDGKDQIVEPESLVKKKRRFLGLGGR